MNSAAKQAPGHVGSVPADMQANIARAVKYPGINTRNWSLFFFFRILRKAETRPVLQIMAEQAKQKAKEPKSKSGKQSDAPTDGQFVEAGVCAEAAGVAGGVAFPAPDEDPEAFHEIMRSVLEVPESQLPSGEFYAWLRRLSSAEFVEAKLQKDPDSKLAKERDRQAGAKLDAKSIHAHLDKMLTGSAPKFDSDKLAPQLAALLMKPDGPMLAVARALELLLGNLSSPKNLQSVIAVIRGLGERLQGNPIAAAWFLFILSSYFKVLVSSPALIGKLLAKFKGDPGTAGLAALHGGLTTMCIYEILRQSAPSIANSKSAGKHQVSGMVRNESVQAQDTDPTSKSARQTPIDPMPVNIAFTFPGLEALHLDAQTLDSFPDAFKEGMAARADRLGDTGPSAPENWDGALGLRSVHGQFSSRFVIGDGETPLPAILWRRLREDIRLFNDRDGARGKLLRALIGSLFRPLGIEILHLELGQDPYKVDPETGHVETVKYRLEHFGFRDGISQPFIDIGLGTPPAGGGTPRRNRTWDRVAPGEIFLGHRDEDGHLQQQPANGLLRDNGTYQVFRKLEQDVVGFRNYLSSQRDTKAEQEKLAAQFMGRWKDGTPLIVSPDREIGLGDDLDGKTNNFLFAKDDPTGAKCPLGSHIRRSNPRDIGGNTDAKRHRILRRGIGYGGPLLPEDSRGDGEERGLLFIAVNSRLDLQFEMIQSNWINNGEYLGQAGLGRCPVIGANNGASSDRFFESGAIAPVHHIPRFVTTRGGDYFFVPSITAMQAIGREEKFPPEPGWQGSGWLDDVVTPSLFQVSRIRQYSRQILSGAKRKIVVKPPEAPVSGNLPDDHTVHEDPVAGKPVTFIGLHSDVKKVLEDNTANLQFSVRHYREAGRRTTRGYDLLIGTELKTETGAARQRLQEILGLAWGDFTQRADFFERLKCITEDSISSTLTRTSQRGQIDLVRDLATDTVYRIVSELFGVPGPKWLTEIAIALPFARKQVGDLERDWLSAMKAEKPENPGLVTLQLWSVIFLADLVGNHMRLGELNILARKAGGEFMAYLEDLLSKARLHRPANPDTLLEIFVDIEAKAINHIRTSKGAAGDPAYSVDDYYIDVIALLLELVGTPMSVIPTAWGNSIGSILNLRIDLPTLFSILGDPEPPLIIGNGQVQQGPYSWISQLLYEVDRINPSFKVFMRYSEEANKIDEQLTLDKDHWVAAMAVCANVDPRVHPNPREFSLYPFLPGPRRSRDNYFMFGSAGGGRDCWGRDRMALYLLDQFIRAAAKLNGLQKVAGPRGDPMKLFEVNVGVPARFARNRIKPVA